MLARGGIGLLVVLRGLQETNENENVSQQVVLHTDTEGVWNISMSLNNSSRISIHIEYLHDLLSLRSYPIVLFRVIDPYLATASNKQRGVQI